MEHQNADEDAHAAALIYHQNAAEDARIAYIVAHSNLEAVPPTRRDGEGLRQFKNRFERYCEPPLRNLGEDYDAYSVRRGRHARKAKEQWQAALTPADHALIYEEQVASQIREDAEEAAWELANPQPTRTPEQLLESEAMILRVRAAFALLDLEGYPDLGELAER